MISESHKFIFVHANKTGGNSVNQALHLYGFKYPADYEYDHESINFPHSQHWTLQEIMKTGDFDDYYKFSISRNPWDRMVSYYRKNVCNPIAAPYVDAEFNDWVKMANIDEVYSYIKDDDGKIGVDYVIDFKFLSIGFSCVMRRLGIDVQLEEIPQMRSDVKTHEGKFFNIKTYHDMYNSESVDIISDAFQNDIKMFGYTYE